MTWADRWFGIAGEYASWSKDPKRGVGAVIVNDRNVQISAGWNGLPRGVEDKPERYSPENKVKWCEHAERNAIYNAAAEGIATRGSKIYSGYFPCSDCARGIIQSGIMAVHSPEPDWDYEPRKEDWKVARDMLNEAGVRIIFV